MMISIPAIQNATANYFNIPRDMMRATSRKFIWSHPRQIAMYLSRELIGASYPRIGKMFSRDHTTALYARRAVEKRLVGCLETNTAVHAIQARLFVCPNEQALRSGAERSACDGLYEIAVALREKRA